MFQIYHLFIYGSALDISCPKLGTISFGRPTDLFCFKFEECSFVNKC